MKINNVELIKKAHAIVKVKKLADSVVVGEVGCALVTDKGNIYTGVSISCCSGIGFCGEHSAIAAMVTNQEYKIDKIVAVIDDGTILPPCGRCRELIYQINPKNKDTKIILGKKKNFTLQKLLPEIWQEKFT